MGISRCAGLPDGERKKPVSGRAPAARGCLIEGEKRLCLGELPLRGAAGLMEEGPVSQGAHAARGCSIDGEKRLFLGELPLRGAARWREGEACFWGSSRCAGLLDGGREKLVSGEAPAARGCRIDGGRQEPVSQGNPSARGCRTDGRRGLFLRERRGCFWGSSRCAGLPDGGREKPRTHTTACKHCIGGIHSGHATTNAREGLL